MANEEVTASDQGYRDELLDRVAVADLIQRERAARDSASWDEMAAYYHPDSTIEVAWFKGSGEEFVRLTKQNWRSSGNINFHELGQAVVTVERDRANRSTYGTFYNPVIQTSAYAGRSRTHEIPVLVSLPNGNTEVFGT